MKKFTKIMVAIVLVLLSFVLFHSLNKYFPGNIISNIIRGFNVVLTPVLIALVILYLVNPLTQRLINKHKLSKTTAIVITMVLVITVTLAVFAFVTWFLVDQGIQLYTQIASPEFLSKIENWFIDNGLKNIYITIYDYISSLKLSDFIGSTNTIMSATLQFLAAIILSPIFLWHFLKSQDIVLNKITDNVPNSWQENIVPVIIDSNKVIVSYFRSKVISMVVLFFMFLATFSLFGLSIEYAILFSIILAVLDLIPYLGPTLGMLIPILYIFSTNGTNMLFISSWHLSGLVANIVLVLVNFIIQFIQGNIIIPRLAGKEMNINSAVILVFMLFFGYVLGVWGIILSIPLGGILFVLWNHLKEKGIFKPKSNSN